MNVLNNIRYCKLAVIIAVYAVVLSYLVFNSNPYLSGMIIVCGFIASVMACGYVLENSESAINKS